MFTQRIALVSKSASISFADLVRTANAINIQVARDFRPIWNVNATVTALQSVDGLEPGTWPVYLVDELPDGVGGFHLTDHHQPFANVLAGDTWSLSASHEVLEMLADPSGNRLIPSQAIGIIENEIQDAASGKFEYLLEVCDPSEDTGCAYLIDGVLVSDFYTPNYFDPVGSAGARYSFSGKIKRPREILPNGYLSWYDPATNALQQARHFGSPEIVTLAFGRPGGGSLTDGRSLRTFVDKETQAPENLSRLHRASAPVARRNLRRDALATAAVSQGALFSMAARAVASVAAVHSPAMNTLDDVKAALVANLTTFGRPGMLSVRPGWKLSRSGTGRVRALVATARPERFRDLVGVLPTSLGGIPVVLQSANPVQQFRAAEPENFHAVAESRNEFRQPEFEGEVFFDGQGQQQAALGATAAVRAQKPRQDYAPPAGATLDAITDDFDLVLHASPDAGWEQLSAFLSEVKKELVVGMYDFTSSHILQAVEAGLAGQKELTLTLDHPAPNPSRDQTDEDTQAALAGALPNFRGAWALTKTDRFAPVWIYPNAYHIKVAVRDRETTWLSSGNWNNSNQPEIDLTDASAARKIAASHDRDWHVIAANKSMAEMFRAFLLNDFEVANRAEQAAAIQAGGAPLAGPTPEVPIELSAAGRSPRRFFGPKLISGHFTIQPLLTPDNYTQHVLPLIRSARSRFYMQTQYIHPSGKPGDEGHDELIAAVRDLVDNGVDVRLITSEFETDDWVEKVVEAGIPERFLRRQPKVHNKGVVVDSSVVMVSSQNWSADGTLRNRDAGLIIHAPEAAAYFEELFLHDWDNLASQVGS